MLKDFSKYEFCTGTSASNLCHQLPETLLKKKNR